MKKLFFAFLCITITLCAHHPSVNYEALHQWCSKINLNEQELKIFYNYLSDLKYFVQCCIQDLNCLKSEDGKKLQAKIDEDVALILKDQSSALVYKSFTYLVKEELGQEAFSVECHRKKEYKILAMVVDGCLACVEKKVKAARPDAPGSQDGSVVGTLLECNLTPILQSLNDLKNIINQTCTMPCAATPITHPITITVPGYYCLANDITGGIIIAPNVNNVTLDLNNHTISGTGPGSGNGITISTGTGRIITNGKITNFDTGISGLRDMSTAITNVQINNCFVEGIHMTAGMRTILDTVLVTNIATNGIRLIGNDTCNFMNVKVTNAQQGMVFQGSTNGYLELCEAVDCSSDFEPITSVNAFQFSGGCSNFTLNNCAVRNFSAFDVPIGFMVNSSENFVMQSCIVQEITQTSTFGTIAEGFLCTEATSNIQFFNCSVEDISGTNTCFGFEIDGTTIALNGCIAQSCIASNFTGNGVGFFTSGNNVAFIGCQAYGCSQNGFSTDSSLATDIYFKTCESVNNEVGFSVFVPNVYVVECCALNNGTGFNIAIAGVAIANCFAAHNGTDYTGVGAINTQSASVPLATAGANLFL